MKGFLLIDKEKGVTSFDVVKRIRGILREEMDVVNEVSGNVKKRLKVGHSGTLDPLATGLLLVAVGEATKLLEFFEGLDKEYEVKAKFGFVSDTFDAEGTRRRRVPAHKTHSGSSDCFSNFEKLEDKEKIEKIKKITEEKFTGRILQVPPKFSALKIKGKKAYELARKGEDFEMKPRDVVVEGFEIIDFDWPFVSFRVACGSGTYIRSLIHDLGAELGCGAYVEELRRTKVGDFSVENAITMKSFDEVCENRDGEFNSESLLIPIEKMLSGFSVYELNDEDFEGLRDGKILKGKKVEEKEVAVIGLYRGKAVGVLKNANEGIKFAKVFG